jgi:hypothetical protein
MRVLLVLVLLVAVGCEPAPPDARSCDYCGRITARYAYACKKCPSHHWACPAEHTMIRFGWSLNQIESCPKPAP